MITPSRARRLIAAACAPLPARRVDIAAALGATLAENVDAPFPLPRFDNSQMDGYAVRARDVGRGRVRLAIVDTVHAGRTARRDLRTGEAMAIMTGAPLPAGADAVVPREAVAVEGKTLIVDGPVRRGCYVRRQGEEIRTGARVLDAGDRLHPGALACLAALGRRSARVVPRPDVTLITTGDEVVAPGRRLERAQVYDSTSTALAAALAHMGFDSPRVRRAGDDAARLRQGFARALAASDVLIVVGGVSVGERDFVRNALGRNRVREIFWRVAQKPGKPLYFGKRGRKLVFGLPGNPASAFTCFYLYVYEALRRLAGADRPGLNERELPLAAATRPDPNLWLHLKGRRDAKGRAVVLPAQGSHMITSLPGIDRLIVIPPGRGTLARGHRVTTLELPFAAGEAP